MSNVEKFAKEQGFINREEQKTGYGWYHPKTGVEIDLHAFYFAQIYADQENASLKERVKELRRGIDYNKMILSGIREDLPKYLKAKKVDGYDPEHFSSKISALIVKAERLLTNNQQIDEQQKR